MTLLSPKLTPRRDYLEGQGDLGSRLIIGIAGVTIWFMGVINIY